jgi:stress response protein YsnF
MRQQQTYTIEQLSELRGTPVYSSDGEKIGDVEEIFYDYSTRQPEWIGIGTGFFGTKRVLVPVDGASGDAEAFTVAYTKDQVKDSPDIDSDEISQETEQELYSYYGLGYSERRSESGLAEGTPRRAGDEASVTRSEEELQVGKRATEAGQARLRKWVETEPAEVDVELRQETARVTREQIDQPVDEGELGEDEVEMTLQKEEPVVQKQTVAKERVGLEKDVDVERKKVRDEVRKERVEVEGDEVER